MSDIDPLSLADHAVMIGLVSRGQAHEAAAEAENGSLDALVKVFGRKGLLTSWQLERLKKGDIHGFFFGNYKVLFHLAEGTFARVYRGIHKDNGMSVAIKVLRQRFSSDPSAVNLFHKEAEAGMKLRHPNIIEILDFGETDKQHYIIMEFLEGANLRDFLKIRPKISPEDALPLMLGLAKGLKYSFEQGVTHRDIKGTNVLISNAGVAKLVDFGLATIDSEDKKTSMQNQRTVDYAALERTCGSEKGDSRSDIYFLGSVFYQMLTGQVPMKEVESKDFLEKMLKRSFGAIVPLNEHRHAPEPELSAIIVKMMKMDLKSRYQNLDDVIKDLELYQTRNKSGILGLESHVGEDEEFLASLDEIFVRKPGSDDAAAVAEHPAHGTEQGHEQGGAAAAKPSTQKQLLCVEAQTEIQDAFRRSLTKIGFRVILVANAEVAAERYRESPPDAVIFDADGLGPEGLQSLVAMSEQARQDRHDFTALVLLGPKQRKLRETLPESDHFVVLQKPVKMKYVQHAIMRLINAK